MRKRLVHIIFILLTVVACEEIYNPVLDNVDNLLVVEAIFTSNKTTNNIYLYKTLGFSTELDSYSAVSGANVYLVDENQVKTSCYESVAGDYVLNLQLQQGAKYYLWIESENETYKSDWQEVPEDPVMDSIYADFENKTSTRGTANSTDNIVTERGIQVYADMNNSGKLNHYRFSARRVLQYFDYYDTIMPPIPEPVKMPIYCWNSYYPTGIFNIAGPPEYSTANNITKHQLEFFEKEYNKYIADTMSFAGWIYYIYQYGINEDTYNYYSDLNSQLDSEGRIFDPVYIQAAGNISCTTTPDIVVLGNFEISSFAEKRYFLLYSKAKDTIIALRNIPYFYNISERDAIKDIKPDFWETVTRDYPDE